MADKEVKLSARAKDKERLASAAKEKKKKLVDFKPKKKIFYIRRKKGLN